MKKIIITFSIISVIILCSVVFMTGCAPTQKITDKSGSQLWGENCNRCHNAPGPGEFSNAQWDVIAFHMKVKANVTDKEVNKIIGFLKGDSM